MGNAFTLIDAVCDAYDNSAWWPDAVPGGPFETYCNRAVAYVAEAMGYKGFPADVLANDLIRFMDGSTDWERVPMAQAQALANRGGLVIAAEPAQPHGHVCVVRPGNAAHSGKWQKAAPKVMNLGKTRDIAKGVNFAFQAEPTFYRWRQE